ncbi:MAG: hypothetical protein ABSB09_02265 [Acidimicrobiales bacterium]|jgi:hypothetical protein
MAFGQPTGPPATGRQIRDLTALIEGAGHADFRDARGPLGLNQRQAGGRFTHDEAAALIARLESEAEQRAGRSGGSDGSDRPSPPVTPPRRPASRGESLAHQLRRVPEELLVDELRRRGWDVTAPGDGPPPAH